ncbi:MAG: hypothetical protein CMH54_04160, partial [Myxococcales bacterium]|nr:hypothetical protein [Myxococcales bacterium]
MPSVKDGEHRLFLGDNLRVLDQLVNSHEGTVDLIYIDPPFATGVDRKYVNRSANRSEDIAYGDIWDGDLTDYLAFMRERLIRLHRLLKPDGSLFLHCDYRASPNLALMCDELFGRGARRPGGTYAGFRNEIIWRYGLGGSSSRCYPHKHDIIFWYSRGETWKFTPPMVPATS